MKDEEIKKKKKRREKKKKNKLLPVRYGDLGCGAVRVECGVGVVVVDGSVCSIFFINFVIIFSYILLLLFILGPISRYYVKINFIVL